MYVGPPTVALVGALEVKATVWLVMPAAPTAKLCWTWGAAVQLVSPAWLASMTQVPTPMKETTPLVSVQPVLVASSVIAGVRPELAVAVGVYVGPPTVALVGALEVKLMTWLVGIARHSSSS